MNNTIKLNVHFTLNSGDKIVKITNGKLPESQFFIFLTAP